MYCLGHFCLICVKNTKNLINLDVNIVLSDENVSLLQILTEIDADLLNFDEIFPKYICNPCKKDLLTTYEFHKRCRKSVDNLNNYILKLNHLRLPSNKHNLKSKKTYTFGYNAITSRHMLFKIKKLTKHNYNSRKSKIKSLSDRSNLSVIDTNYSESISDTSTTIIEKTGNVHLKNTIDKLARYLNITDLDKLDHKHLEQNNLEQDESDVVNQDDSNLKINQNLSQNDLLHLDQEFYETFNVTDDYFVKEENALDLGSCDLSDISSGSKKNIKNEMKAEKTTNLDTFIDLTATSNNNCIDLTVSPKKSDILQDASNSPFRSRDIRTENCIDLTVSPSKSSNSLDRGSKDVGEFVNHFQSVETNLDLKLTGSNNSIIMCSEVEASNQSVVSNNSEDILEPKILDDSVLNESYETLINLIELNVKQELIDSEIKQELIINELTSNLDRSNDDSSNSSELESKQDISVETDRVFGEDFVLSKFYTEDLNMTSSSKSSELDIEEHPVKYDPEEMQDIKIEIKELLENHENLDRSAPNSEFPEKQIKDLNVSSSKSSELDIEEHPIKYDPEEMQEIKIEIEEILEEHANLEPDTSKNNNNKRKLDLKESKQDPKRSKHVTAKKVPDLTTFSSKVILSSDVKDPKKRQEPNDPNLKESSKNVPDLVAFSSKLIENAQLVLSKNVNDPKKIKEPNDPNSEPNSKIKDTKPINSTSTKCDISLLSTTINDPNLEPKIAPNDPNVRSKRGKNTNLIYIDVSNTVFMPRKAQEPNDPNCSHQTIVPKSPVHLESIKDPNSFAKDPTILLPSETKSGSSEDPNKKVLIKIKFFKKPFIIKDDPNVQELELFDLNDPKMNKKTRLPKLCHNEERPEKLGVFKNIVPNDPREVVLDPEDLKTKDFDPNQKLKLDLEENKHLKDNKHLSFKKNDLEVPKPNNQNSNDPNSNNKDPNDPKIKHSPLNDKLNVDLEENNLSSKKIDPNEPKSNNNDPNDQKLKNKNTNDPIVENLNLDVHCSPKKLDLKESSSICKSPNDPKAKNLEPNDPHAKNQDIPETKPMNESKSPKKMESSKNPKDPKTRILDLNDPKPQNLIPIELQSNELNKIDSVGSESMDSNDPKSGPTDPDPINKDTANKNTNKSKNIVPEKAEINDPISKHVDKDPNPSTSSSNVILTPRYCRFCSNVYETGLQLKCHIFDAHKNKFNECAKCKTTFSKRNMLLRHIEMYHTDASIAFRGKVPDLRDIDFRNYDYPSFESYDNWPGAYDAPSFRNEYFRSGNCFRNDDLRSRSLGPYVCDLCNRSFFSSFNLNKHYNLVHYF